MSIKIIFNLQFVFEKFLITPFTPRLSVSHFYQSIDFSSYIIKRILYIVCIDCFIPDKVFYITSLPCSRRTNFQSTPQFCLSVNRLFFLYSKKNIIFCVCWLFHSRQKFSISSHFHVLVQLTSKVLLNFVYPVMLFILYLCSYASQADSNLVIMRNILCLSKLTWPISGLSETRSQMQSISVTRPNQSRSHSASLCTKFPKDRKHCKKKRLALI